MYTAERVVENETVAEHTEFLASVGRHLLLSELEPMLEAVARAALPLLGEVFVLDGIEDGLAKRLFEHRRDTHTWIEAPHRLAAINKTETCTDGHCFRVSVPVRGASGRIGTLSVASRHASYGCAETNVIAELAERVGLAIENISRQSALKEALDGRDKLISIAAHELRGSTCSMRLSVHSLRLAAANLPPKGVRLLSVIDREERRVSRMIEELFEMGRVGSGQIDLTIESLDLCEVVREVVGRFADADATAKKRIRLELPGQALGEWDHSRLSQIVHNLVSNALKFGGDGPITVRVRADGTGRRMQLDVSDQGPGIDPSVAPLIFEPFKRDRRLGRDGLGLGLYIIRNLIRAFGGDIQVATAVGVGTTFTVELPSRRN